MRSTDWAIAIVALLASFTIVVGAVAELGEQSRFRTAVDPAATVVAAVIVARLFAGVRRRRATRQSQADAVGR
jgi:hypothetical protein